MAIQLDTPQTSTRPPVIGAREVGAVINGMIIDKEQRQRQDKDGKPILNSRGKPAQEEVLTILVLDGTTGTVSGGELDDDATPDAGTVARIIVKGLAYGALIDARKAVGPTTVGDVITVTARSATIWRGAGDIAAKDVVDAATIAKARSKGLSVGFDLAIGYRRSTAAEAKLVTECERLWHERQQANAIVLDAKPDSSVDLEPF